MPSAASNGYSEEDPSDEIFADEPSSLPGSGASAANGNDDAPSSRDATSEHILSRHDSMFSVDSDYEDPSDNDLNIYQGAALLTADCMGTGLLALPEDIAVLGRWLGLGFLVLNLPINLYAGTILSDAAGYVEDTQTRENEILEREAEDQQLGGSSHSNAGLMKESSKQKRGNRTSTNNYATVSASEDDDDDNGRQEEYPAHDGTNAHVPTNTSADHKRHAHHDTATFDFIGMTQALFTSRAWTRCVMFIFYTNIFLVLGDYILVMAHAVSALVGEDNICLPLAGLLACTLMFAVSQARSMAKLGRAASIISLSALTGVVFQCLWAIHTNTNQLYVEASAEDFDVVAEMSAGQSLLRKLSALGSIGFAVGSQKLFLNIRHELRERSQAPKSLAMSLSAFGVVYIGIILLAGSNPPGFLFDAIGPGWNRKLAGFLLWIHVVVSYAINSQAMCASMDRLFFSTIELRGLNKKPRIRWMCLTAILAAMAFLVANAIPFFKDLVALIGALTSVPLALTLPAAFFRRYIGFPIWIPTRKSMASYALIIFSLLFMSTALAGSLSSIEMDWSKHGGPFACH